MMNVSLTIRQAKALVRKLRLHSRAKKREMAASTHETKCNRYWRPRTPEERAHLHRLQDDAFRQQTLCFLCQKLESIKRYDDAAQTSPSERGTFVHLSIAIIDTLERFGGPAREELAHELRPVYDEVLEERSRIQAKLDELRRRLEDPEVYRRTEETISGLNGIAERQTITNALLGLVEHIDYDDSLDDSDGIFGQIRRVHTERAEALSRFRREMHRLPQHAWPAIRRLPFWPVMQLGLKHLRKLFGLFAPPVSIPREVEADLPPVAHPTVFVSVGGGGPPPRQCLYSAFITSRAPPERESPQGMTGVPARAFLRSFLSA